VLVDVVAGAAALRSAGSHWIATLDLRVHWLRPVVAGELVARAEPLRSGRTSIVIEVTVEAAGARVARGAVGFSRLPATGEYQTRPREQSVARIEWGAGRAGFALPWSERIGAVVHDLEAGVVELPLTPYVGNSLGGLQGGIGVALLDLAAEAAASARLGPAVATRDLAVHFLALGRTGPLRTRVELLRQDHALLLRVESRDTGAGDRLCALASATVGAPLP
jgi:acyl-coenzyme A thioesterase PaaI-like protein